MRLLFVTDYYPPLVGGATRAFEQLALRMEALGHNVTVATASQPGLPAFERHNGIAVHRLRDLVSRIPGTSLDRYRHTPPPFPDPELVWRLRRLVRGTAPDLIYTFGWLTYSLCASLPRDHAPLILSVRDYGNICAKRTLVRRGRGCSGPGWRKCLDCAPDLYGPLRGVVSTFGILGGRWLIRRRVSAVQSCSKFAETIVLANLFADDRPDPSRAYVIPDFRDQAGEGPITLPEGLPSEPFILFVGAIREIKGIGILLDAYEQIRSPKPPLIMIGARGPETPDSFPAGVRLMEPMSNASVLAAWDRALFGVAPSLLPEPLGNVIHEAMSRGKPVIGTTPGGHADMIEDEVSGLLVPAGDGPALKAAMERLLSDSALRARLGSAAQLQAQAFTAERVFPRFVRMFFAEQQRPMTPA